MANFEFLEEYLEQQVDRLMPTHDLGSESELAFRQRQKARLALSFRNYYERVKRGVGHLIAVAGGMLKETLELVDYEVLTPERLHVHRIQGKVLGAIGELDDEMVEQCYEIASDLHARRLCEEGSEVFSFLALVRPRYASFWVGLGACEASVGSYGPALAAYKLARLVDPQDPTAYVYAADSQIKLGDKVAAKLLLERALSLSPADELRTWASFLLETSLPR